MSVVYFIKPVGMAGPIKIGCTTLIRDRMHSLQAWSPVHLELIAELPGSYETERRLHAMFLSTRQRGEWFTWSPELQAVIDQIAAGEFDAQSLPGPVFLPHVDKCKVARRPRDQVTFDPGLLGDILTFCDQHDIPPATFGRAAVKDPALIRNMRQGRVPRMRVTKRLRDFMVAYRAPTTAKPRKSADQQSVAA